MTDNIAHTINISMQNYGHDPGGVDRVETIIKLDGKAWTRLKPGDSMEIDMSTQIQFQLWTERHE